MSRPDDLRSVLAAYPAQCGPRRIEPLGSAGGFSGARFWRLTTDSDVLCLRRWPPEHPTPDRLAGIHAVLNHAAACGVVEVAAPLIDRRGRTFVQVDGLLWELTRWMPGEADYHRRPSPKKLRAAMQTLARFHLAAATCPESPLRAGPSPGINQRRQFLRTLLGEGTRRLEDAIGPRDWPELDRQARRLLALFPHAAGGVADRLAAAGELHFPLQACIRDVWHDHVLFTGDVVTGVIDFGAMRTDNVACDVARLLGSLVGDAVDQRQRGLEAYHSVRPLSNEERQLLDAFDRSSVLLSGINWLRWIYLEGRTFDDRQKVIGRLDEAIGRLEHLTGVASG